MSPSFPVTQQWSCSHFSLEEQQTFFYESHFFLNTQKFIDFCFVSPILSKNAYIFCISGVKNVVNCLLKQNTRSGWNTHFRWLHCHSHKPCAFDFLLQNCIFCNIKTDQLWHKLCYPHSSVLCDLAHAGRTLWALGVSTGNGELSAGQAMQAAVCASPHPVVMAPMHRNLLCSPWVAMPPAAIPCFHSSSHAGMSAPNAPICELQEP